MKNWVKFLLPIAIILAGILVGQKVFQNKQNKTVMSGYITTVAGISKDTVDGLVISDEKGLITFYKQEGIWKLDEKKADQEKINNIISILLDTDGTNYDLISQNPDRFNDFNVSSTSANVSLSSSGKEKLTIIVGNASYPGNFIRPAKENNVYLTKKSLGSISTSDKQSYLEKLPQK